MNDNERMRNLNYKISKPHPFIAGLCDVYFISFAFGLIQAIIINFLGRPLFDETIRVFLPFVSFAVLLVAVILYYKVFYKKTSWLSLGERICSRFILEGKKEWLNPYEINRWGLFLIIIITFLISGKEWDQLTLGYVYPLGMITGKAIRFTFLCLGLIMTGEGKLYGTLIVIATLIISAITSFLITSVNELAGFSAKFYGVLAAAFLVIYLYYYFIISKAKKTEIS